ncbi:hypothetical protein [Neorhizobium sp. NCHU2750]|uniref:hypothetical protein n=1 Tax=Neorhizobium sp. NCHU2750 TaxID=1825976 RepID=UPI000E7470F7|nr:hypothetical protein NCHU2750_25180 [Neorhizobium sp. NCHU2750]
MFRNIVFSAIIVMFSSAAAFATEFGDLAGTYSGKTEKGSAVVFTIPKSGTPSYRFKGEPISVNTSSLSGKTITMRVGSGGGKITLTSTGKSTMQMQYSYMKDRASALLTKE